MSLLSDHLCECGCGERTNVARRTRGSSKKGMPLRFVKNHHPRRKKVRWRVEDRGYETPCWIWTVCVGGDGYGRDCVNGKNNLYAHKTTYERLVGRVPAGLELDHLCRNRACVNPDHLEPVTSATNKRRGAGVKLTEGAVVHMRESLETQAELANRFGVSIGTVARVRTGVLWEHLSGEDVAADG